MTFGVTSNSEGSSGGNFLRTEVRCQQVLVRSFRGAEIFLCAAATGENDTLVAEVTAMVESRHNLFLMRVRRYAV